MIIKAHFKISKEELGYSRIKEDFLVHARDKLSSSIGVKLSPLFEKVESWNNGDHCEMLEIAVFTRYQFRDLYSAITNGQTEKALKILESNIPEIKLDEK